MPVTTPPKVHAIFDITASTNDRFRIDTATVDFDVQLSAGSGETSGYYIRTYTAEAIPTGRSTVAGSAGLGAQLVEEIQARVRQAATAAGNGNFGSFTCTVSDTGIVEMVNLAQAFAVVEHSGGGTAWANASTGLAQILGYTGTLGSATTQTAPNQHRYGWYPNVSPANVRGMTDVADIPSSDAVVQRAPSGLVTTRRYSTALRDQMFLFDYLDEERAFIQSSGDTNESLEQFWLDALSTGARLRYYQDRTVQTAPGGGAPWGYVGQQKIARDGPQSFAQTVDFHDGLWRAELDLHRFVASP